MGDVASGSGINVIADAKFFLQEALGQQGEVDALHATGDRRQQAFGRVGQKDKDRQLRRFFEDFQQFVLHFYRHLIGLPNNHHFITALIGHKTQLFYDGIAIGYVKSGLLILHLQRCQPILVIEVGGSQEALAPRFEIGIARTCTAFSYCRENEMQVGVSVARNHLAARTTAAGIALGRPVRAEQRRS